MEVLNKLMPLLMAVTISVNLSGCGNRAGAESGQPSETTTTTVQTETTEKKELKQVSVEEFANSLYIEGKHIPFPCTFGELCESYGFNGIEESGSSGVFVDENGKYADIDTGLIKYTYNLFLDDDSNQPSYLREYIQCSVIAENPDRISDSYVIRMIYYPKDDSFDISGFDINSKYEDMISILGEDYTYNNMGNYEYSENELSLQFEFGDINYTEGSPYKEGLIHIIFGYNNSYKGD